MFQIGANETENDSDSVKQKNPILSDAEIKLKLALDEKKKQEKKYLEKMKKLNREVQTLKQSLTCKLCMDKEVCFLLTASVAWENLGIALIKVYADFFLKL